MTFPIVSLTKWTHLEYILSIENIYNCLVFEKNNELVSGKLEYTRKKTKSSVRFFGHYTSV